MTTPIFGEKNFNLFSIYEYNLYFPPSKSKLGSSYTWQHYFQRLNFIPQYQCAIFYLFSFLPLIIYLFLYFLLLETMLHLLIGYSISCGRELLSFFLKKNFLKLNCLVKKCAHVYGFQFLLPHCLLEKPLELTSSSAQGLFSPCSYQSVTIFLVNM